MLNLKNYSSFKHPSGHIALSDMFNRMTFLFLSIWEIRKIESKISSVLDVKISLNRILDTDDRFYTKGSSSLKNWTPYEFPIRHKVSISLLV